MAFRSASPMARRWPAAALRSPPVAEDTDDAYADGSCVGSAIGIVDGRDVVRELWRLRPALKVEGIAVVQDDKGTTLEVVTDADDPKVPARLLSVSLQRERKT
jgi:hypothetical protein